MNGNLKKPLNVKVRICKLECCYKIVVSTLFSWALRQYWGHEGNSSLVYEYPPKAIDAAYNKYKNKNQSVYVNDAK